MKTAIVLGGSRGIGKAIADSLKSIDCDVIATSKNELDTSSLESVSSFAEKHNEVDILVLNTGGPEPKEFFFRNRRRLESLPQPIVSRLLSALTKDQGQ